MITDLELKERLLPAAYNQNQIINCSHLFIFCSYRSVFEEDIDENDYKNPKRANLDPTKFTKDIVDKEWEESFSKYKEENE